jgi:hypothetical protein
MVEFLDPRAEPAVAVEPYTLSIDPTDGPISIGLLANGFPDSVGFLDRVEAALQQTLPQARFRRYDKGNASVGVSDDMLDAIVRECDAVVSAYGH